MLQLNVIILTRAFLDGVDEINWRRETQMKILIKINTCFVKGWQGVWT